VADILALTTAGHFSSRVEIDYGTPGNVPVGFDGMWAKLLLFRVFHIYISSDKIACAT
jgi:hypothetical protein